MLSLLLDQHISPEIAAQVRIKRPEIPIVSIYDWRDGDFVGIADRLILQAASEDRVTLLTYDRKSIPPLLRELGVAGVTHAGVVFVDNLTIASNDFGRLIRALTYYWSREQSGDWTNRVAFLPAPW
jgi:hypothetical protein